MQDNRNLEIHISHEQEGTYFTLPFTVPDNIVSLTLNYRYERRLEQLITLENGVFVGKPEENIIDLGLISPDGAQVGASGSDKTRISVSEWYATPGYRPCKIIPGKWQILVGAYKVASEGVHVQYDVILDCKEMRLLKGDLHVHSLASDGVHSVEELAIKAQRNGLDFVAVTDHNQMVTADALPRLPGVTMIPGMEWTHYQGHANFLGSDKPYDQPFATNTIEEAHSRFKSAHQRGALITINHPFEEPWHFQFDMAELPFDCIEVWNGPMRECNLRAVGLWQQWLSAGKKIPVCGGSDYHRDSPFIFLGGPTTGVYALSPGASDILDALRHGHAYITFAPNGPSIEVTAGDAIMGDTVRWSAVKDLHINAGGLLAGDVLRVVTDRSTENVLECPSDGNASLIYPMAGSGFARVEILRSFLPGLPMLPALISNPIYFED